MDCAYCNESLTAKFYLSGRLSSVTVQSQPGWCRWPWFSLFLMDKGYQRDCYRCSESAGKIHFSFGLHGCGQWLHLVFQVYLPWWRFILQELRCSWVLMAWHTKGMQDICQNHCWRFVSEGRMPYVDIKLILRAFICHWSFQLIFLYCKLPQFIHWPWWPCKTASVHLAASSRSSGPPTFAPKGLSPDLLYPVELSLS